MTETKVQKLTKDFTQALCTVLENYSSENTHFTLHEIMLSLSCAEYAIIYSITED